MEKNIHSVKQYKEMYEQSLSHPDQFWAEQAKKFIHWSKHWHTVLEGDFKEGKARWFEGGELNACYNCVDRHLPARANQIAIIWEGDDPTQSKKITYAELHQQVCRFANVLKKQGVKSGDRVCIYMPMIPEAAIAMLACARIGAIHSVVFGGFSPNALKDRILDADCKIVITADEGIRGGKIVPLKLNTDAALASCPNVKTVIVIQRTGNKIPWQPERDIWYHDAVTEVSADCPIANMSANAPLFILYTSGSTGKPKGVLHTTGGYMVYAAMTHFYVFGLQENDIYWCTADVGWITGHSYLVYGPLANGATTLMFEGTPQYPSYSRLWEIVDKYQVTIFYTAPTTLRALLHEGDEPVKKTKRQSLRILGTVGEPINPEVWEWYYRVVGEQRCPIMDTWWQTETGGILLTPLPDVTVLKPGSVTKPFFGIAPALLDSKLVITKPWPGLMATIYGDHQRFVDTYFKNSQGYYLTGDGARCDEDGDYWITGRIDDVINVSGHRLGTAEIESALVKHPLVSEAAVVGYPHDIKGQGIYAYVVTMVNVTPDGKLKNELIQLVRSEISPIATPDIIQWVNGLPKTRSGKIMRRILRKIADHDLENLGDTSTLADPDVVKEIVKGCVHKN